MISVEHELEEAERELDEPVRRQGPKPRATSASAWRRDEVELHTLPSGNTASLQRPQMTELMKSGKIPNTLIGAAVDMANGRATSDYDEVIELLDFLIAAAFVEPRISLAAEPAEGELPISALSDADRNYVLIWAQQGVAGLQRFRLDGSGAAGGGDGGDVRDEAE